MQKVDETQETAPSQPAGASTVTGAEKLIAAQTLPEADAVLVPPGPVTLSVRLYACVVAPPSDGKVMGTVTRAGLEPAAQAVVIGRPAAAGVTEIVHCADRLTVADRTVAPPAEGRSAGLTATWLIAGGASRTATVTGLAAILPPAPVTVRPNL
jgi:hypothetical protein